MNGSIWISRAMELSKRLAASLARESVVWADDASPFTGPQVKTLLDENEGIRAQLSSELEANSATEAMLLMERDAARARVAELEEALQGAGVFMAELTAARTVVEAARGLVTTQLTTGPLTRPVQAALTAYGATRRHGT